MSENNNDNLNKLIEDQRQERRWGQIKDLIQTTLFLLPTLFLIWEKFKSKKISPKKRLMRNEAARARLKLNSESAQAKLQLEREIILKEIRHEEELTKMETGLDQETKTNLDFFSTFKPKGESLLKDKLKVVDNEVIEKVKNKVFDQEKKE